MHAIVRTYHGHGAAELFDLLESRKTEVEDAIRQVPGFVSYTLMRTQHGGVAVTVCQSKEGTDASVAVSREWLKAHAAHLQIAPPSYAEGEVLIHAPAEGVLETD